MIFTFLSYLMTKVSSICYSFSIQMVLFMINQFIEIDVSVRKAVYQRLTDWTLEPD